MKMMNQMMMRLGMRLKGRLWRTLSQQKSYLRVNCKIALR
jgi:hypothetical protein